MPVLSHWCRARAAFTVHSHEPHSIKAQGCVHRLMIDEHLYEHMHCQSLFIYDLLSRIANERITHQIIGHMLYTYIYIKFVIFVWSQCCSCSPCCASKILHRKPIDCKHRCHSTIAVAYPWLSAPRLAMSSMSMHVSAQPLQCRNSSLIISHYL